MANNPGFDCTRCPKVPRSRANLVEHLKTHHRPWICTTCALGFVRHDKFVIHVASHGGRGTTPAEEATGRAISRALDGESRGLGFVLPAGVLPITAAPPHPLAPIARVAAPLPAQVAAPLPAPVVVAGPPPPKAPLGPPLMAHLASPPAVIAAPPAPPQQLPLPPPLPTGAPTYANTSDWPECNQQ